MLAPRSGCHGRLPSLRNLLPCRSEQAFPFLLWRTYPLFFGNAAFTFCIHTVAIPVHASLKDPEGDYEKAVDRSTLFVAVINIVFAAACSLLFNRAGVQVKGVWMECRWRAVVVLSPNQSASRFVDCGRRSQHAG
jgi:hypothetical protein